MAPFGISWNPGKSRPNKQTLDQILSNQEARRRADLERTAARAEGRQPIVDQPRQASMMRAPGAGTRNAARREAPDLPGAQAEQASQAGFLSFVRDCCPTLPFERWFGGGGRGRDLESATDPGAYAPLAGSDLGRKSRRDENIPMIDRAESRTVPLAGAERAAGGTDGMSPLAPPERRATLPAESTGTTSQFETAVGTGRERNEPKMRKRRHSEAPGHDAPAARQADEAAAAGAKRKASLPTPEGWKLSDTRPRREKELQPVAQRKADEFRNLIRLGYKPQDAANLLGPGSQLKQLRAADSQYEIRLNQHDRLTFRSDPETKEVTILEIGGHT